MAGLSDEDVGLAPRAPQGLSDEDVGLAAPAAERPERSIAMQFNPSLPTGFEGVPGVGLPNNPAPPAPEPAPLPGGVPGSMEGVDVPGVMAPEAPKYQTPIASQFAGAPTTEPPPGVEVPNVNDRRVGIMARDAFENGSVGALVNRVEAGQVDQQAADQAFRAIVEARQAGSPVALRNFNPTPEEQKKYANNPSILANPFVGMPVAELEAKFNELSQTAGGKREVYDAKREANDKEMQSLPDWTNAETPQGAIGQGIKSLTGSLLGGFGNPENLIGGPGKEQAAKVIGESLLKRGAKEVAPGVVAGATGATIASPVVQAGKISRGEQEGFDPAQMGENVLLGSAVGGAFHLPGMLWQGVRDVIAARRGIPADKVDPAHVGPAEIQEAFKDPQIAALAKANGIESPTDARVPVLEQKLAARKEADTLRTPDQPAQSLKAQDAEILRRQNEKAGVADETINPAATNLRPRSPDETPIRVDREGNAFRADAGALEGKAKAEALQRADMKLLPAPEDRTGTREGQLDSPNSEGINVQRRGTQADRPHGGIEDVTPEPPPKLYGGENRLPEAADGRALVDYASQKTSTKAADLVEGRLATDPNGYVASDKGGPVRFAQEKQAEKFATSQGKKTGQDFEVVDHPAGKGFTVQERAPEAQAPRQIEDMRNIRGESLPTRGLAPANMTDRGVVYVGKPGGPHYQIAEKFPAAKYGEHVNTGFITPEGKFLNREEALAWVNKNEKTVKPSEGMEGQLDAADYRDQVSSRGEASRQIEDQRPYDEKVSAERDRLWAEEMPGYKRDKTGNDGMVEASARETVMRREAAEQVAGAEREGLDDRGAHELAQLYRRADGETPQQAWDRAVDRWTEKTEAEAIAHENGMGAEDSAHDMLDRGGETLYTDNHDAIHGPEVNHEAIPFEHDTAGEPHGGDGNATGGEQPGRSEGERVGGQAEHGGEVASRNTDAGPDGGRQTVIPGAERLTDRALAERQGGKPLRGGDEPPPKGGLFDEDARNQKDMFDPKSTMHAGAIFDPAVWKWFGSKIAGDKYLREMRALLKDRAEDKADTRGRKTNKAADAARFVFYSVDGQMRALADAIKSPTVKKVADLFFTPADAGRGGALDPGYHEAVTTRSGRNLNKLSEIMEKLGDKPGAMDQVVKLVQNPRNIKPGTVVHDAAAAITKLLAEEHSYLKAAGIDVGKVIGYYPREINVASVMKNGDAFRLAAERAYKASGLGAQEAKEAAEQWLSRVVLGGVNIRPEGTDFVHLGGTPSSKFSKGRELSKAADEIMAPFYHRDPLEALTTYFQRTARRAEWARRMGDYVKGPDGKMVFDELGAWKKMKAEMIAEGNAAAVRQVVGMVSSSVGANSATLPHGADALIGLLKAYGTIKLLTHAAITSASESVLPAIRAGAPHRILTDMPRTVAALFAKSGKLGEQRAFAEDLGLVMRGAANGILAARYSAIDPASRVRERIMNRNFRMSGLEQWTSATRVMAVNGAEAFIRRLGLDVADSKLRQVSSRNLLKELGVQDTAGFAKWVKENEGSLKGRDVTTGGFSTVYRNAVVRFVHQSIMEVSASTRPQWANHPVGSLIFMLQSYNMAYQKNVTARAGHQIMSAVTGKGMNLADRATMLSPLALIPAMFAIQMGLAPARNAVFNSAHQKPKSDEDQLTNNMIQAASRSVTGAFDPLVQIFTSAKYHSSSENILGGAVAAGIGQLADAVVAMTPKEVGGPNSPKTNAAERNVTRNIYDSVIAPAIVTAGALSPSWLGAILTQAPSLAPVKDAVIDSVAGAPTKQGASGRPQRPTRK